MQIHANISMLYTDLEMPERIIAAAQDGFSGVELQFPDESDISALADASETAGIPIVLINVPRGHPTDVGLAALPGREAEFRATVAQCADQAKRLGVSKVNALAGRVPSDVDPQDCAKTFRRNLQYAADVMAELSVRVMVEPVNGVDLPGFYLTDLGSALDAIELADRDNIALQFDLYHMAKTEPDLIEAINQAGSRIGHVQFADTPGRHEPGTGLIDFDSALTALHRQKYRGAISAEYYPSGKTSDGLDWLDAFKRII